MNLRILRKKVYDDGTRQMHEDVLQYEATILDQAGGYIGTKWKDVPIVMEEEL